MSADSAIRAEFLAKTYRSGASEVVVFDGLSLDVRRGELIAIIGESGAGKSTLLHLLGGLDRPSKGRIYFGHRDLGSLSDKQLADFRNKTLGFVWQSPSLLPEFTALENVMMPLLIRGMEPEEAGAIAKARLTEVGLQTRELHRPGELSGGEQQRVALARALAGNPEVLLADEPTGSLDHKTGEMIMGALKDLHRAHGLTSIFVTHNLAFARQCERILELRKGNLFAADIAEAQVAGVGRDATRLGGGNYV
ncbi:MAG TPA: ABC transporter ATP-binding protein [Bryobacteraceae bacterium]|nr:ABC transporter ATP-binding protein [Bryobacteraceae bacterium]